MRPVSSRAARWDSRTLPRSKPTSPEEVTRVRSRQIRNEFSGGTREPSPDRSRREPVCDRSRPNLD
uniref:Uncharacterized protein n=1 Tax=Fagus sylvatica TaxID=28930 RepID=A0A2N9IT73_FAGSY